MQKMVDGSATSVKPDRPHVLLINPWIHDFAAYDFWAKPLGLLMLSGILRQHGFRVSYRDCLDRFHSEAPLQSVCAAWPRSLPQDPDSETGSLCGYPPEFLALRNRAGMVPKGPGGAGPAGSCLDGLADDLLVPGCSGSHPDHPRGVCGDAYHPGRHLRDPVPAARRFAFRGRSGSVRSCRRQILELAGRYTGFFAKPRFDPDVMDTYPYPAFDLQSRVNYVPLLTSRGCPFACDYCASHRLFPGRVKRKPEGVVAEIEFWHRARGVKDFVFYDDALLLDAEKHAVPLFEAVIRAGLKVFFHLPNAVHIRGISGPVADLMCRAGVKTVRLGLETADFSQDRRLDAKVTAAEFVRALTLLKEAGFQQPGRGLSAGGNSGPVAWVDCGFDQERQRERDYARAGILFSDSADAAMGSGGGKLALSAGRRPDLYQQCRASLHSGRLFLANRVLSEKSGGRFVCLALPGITPGIP